jgi:tetratricopeptide (TPR) repeat protein
MRLCVAIVFFAFTATTAFALDSQSILRDGWEHFNNQNYNSASKTFENAARIDPASSEALKGLGMSYMKMGCSEKSTDLGLVEKAAAAFQKALQLNPNMPEVSYQLGLACLVLNDKAGAEKQYQALIPTSKPLADKLASKIVNYIPQEQYQLVGETIIDSGGPTSRRQVMRCGPGQSWNSITNTCAESSASIAERSSREEMANQDRESRERIANEQLKAMKKTRSSPTIGINANTGEVVPIIPLD